MSALANTQAHRPRNAADAPYHVTHDSFDDRDAESVYHPRRPAAPAEAGNFMADEVNARTGAANALCRLSHGGAATPAQRKKWHAVYLARRDAIVVGNRKLIYRAVRRWMPPAMWEDDMIGDCQIVLIQAVAAYNPWLGIRFSTYAFTCLMRALSRLSQRHAADRLSKSLPLAALPNGEPRNLDSLEEPVASLRRIDEFMREGNDLLSVREKKVLQRRFRLDDRARAGTLEEVGRELGLSKERVRQVQAGAIDKLRKAMTDASPAFGDGSVGKPT